MQMQIFDFLINKYKNLLYLKNYKYKSFFLFISFFLFFWIFIKIEFLKSLICKDHKIN